MAAKEAAPTKEEILQYDADVIQILTRAEAIASLKALKIEVVPKTNTVMLKAKLKKQIDKEKGRKPKE